MCSGVFAMGVRFPETVAIDRCELPGSCWELDLGSLEEQSVRLTLDQSL